HTIWKRDWSSDVCSSDLSPAFYQCPFRRSRQLLDCILPFHRFAFRSEFLIVSECHGKSVPCIFCTRTAVMGPDPFRKICGITRIQRLICTFHNICIVLSHSIPPASLPNIRRRYHIYKTAAAHPHRPGCGTPLPRGQTLPSPHFHHYKHTGAV